jgi:transposase
VQAAAGLLERHQVTVQEWLRLYRKAGLTVFLSHKSRVGRQHSIPQWVQEALNKQLQQEEGFNSYDEMCQWLESQLGTMAPYKTVHQLVYYRLKASPKVARPISAEQSPKN